MPGDRRARNGGKAGGIGVHKGADQHDDRTGVVKTEGIVKQKNVDPPLHSLGSKILSTMNFLLRCNIIKRINQGSC